MKRSPCGCPIYKALSRLRLSRVAQNFIALTFPQSLSSILPLETAALWSRQWHRRPAEPRTAILLLPNVQLMPEWSDTNRGRKWICISRTCWHCVVGKSLLHTMEVLSARLQQSDPFGSTGFLRYSVVVTCNDSLLGLFNLHQSQLMDSFSFSFLLFHNIKQTHWVTLHFSGKILLNFQEQNTKHLSQSSLQPISLLILTEV